MFAAFWPYPSIGQGKGGAIIWGTGGGFVFGAPSLLRSIFLASSHAGGDFTSLYVQENQLPQLSGLIFSPDADDALLPPSATERKREMLVAAAACMTLETSFPAAFLFVTVVISRPPVAAVKFAAATCIDARDEFSLLASALPPGCVNLARLGLLGPEYDVLLRLGLVFLAF